MMRNDLFVWWSLNQDRTFKLSFVRHVFLSRLCNRHRIEIPTTSLSFCVILSSKHARGYKHTHTYTHNTQYSCTHIFTYNITLSSLEIVCSNSSSTREKNAKRFNITSFAYLYELIIFFYERQDTRRFKMTKKMYEWSFSSFLFFFLFFFFLLVALVEKNSKLEVQIRVRRKRGIEMEKEEKRKKVI